jgi:hypothetical protein
MDWIDAEAPHLRELVGNENDLTVLLDSLAAIRRSAHSGSILASDRSLLLAAIGSQHEAVWDKAIAYIIRLSEAVPSALELLKEAAHARSAVSRFNVCASIIGTSFPTELCSELTLHFMADASAKVRCKVVDVCLRRGMSDSIPALLDMKDREIDEKVRSSIDMTIGLLRDGKYDNGRYTVYLYPNGEISTTPP